MDDEKAEGRRGRGGFKRSYRPRYVRRGGKSGDDDGPATSGDEADREVCFRSVKLVQINVSTTLEQLTYSFHFRGKTEDVAEAEVDSEVAEGSGAEVASEVVAEDSVEASEAASGAEEAVIEEGTEGCHSGAAEAEAVAHHFVEVEAEEKAARDNVTTLNITLKTTFGKLTLSSATASSSTLQLFWAFSRDLFSIKI